MTQKKAKEKRTFTEAEEAIMTEDEKKILEEESTEEGEKGEPEGSETKPKEEGKPKEPPEEKPGEGKEGEKPKDEGEAKGAKPPEGVEGEKVTIVVDGEEIEGAIAKGGGYVIPYSEVKKRDEKYARAKTETETLKAEIAALKARQEKPPEEKKPEEESYLDIDFDALETKLYETEDVTGFLKDFAEKVHKTRKPPEPKSEEKSEVKQESPEQIAMRVRKGIVLEDGIKAIIKENPKIDETNEAYDKKTEYVYTQMGLMTLGEKMKEIMEEGQKLGKTEAEWKADQVAWTDIPENLLAITKEAVVRSKEVLGGSTGDFDPEKEREKIRLEEQTKSLEWAKKKLNLKEEDVKTLGDVRDGSGDTGIGKFSHIDSLEGEEYEDAVAAMTPEERQNYDQHKKNE